MVREVFVMIDNLMIVLYIGFKGVCDMLCNFEDDFMKEIVVEGGFIGIGYWDVVVCDIFLVGIVKFIVYGIGFVGVDYIVLGLDYDGFIIVSFDILELSVLIEEFLKVGVFW